MKPISRAQIIKIKSLQSALKLPDEEYRALVSSVTADGFAASCKELSFNQAGKLIEIMEQRAVEAGVWKRRGIFSPDNFMPGGDDREGFATGKQQNLIRLMFRQVSWYKDNPRAFDHALRNFLQRIAHVDSLRFLERKDVQKVIRALKAMKEAK